MDQALKVAAQPPREGTYGVPDLRHIRNPAEAYHGPSISFDSSALRGPLWANESAEYKKNKSRRMLAILLVIMYVCSQAIKTFGANLITDFLQSLRATLGFVSLIANLHLRG